MANVVPRINPDIQAVMQKGEALKDIGREVAQLARTLARDQTAWSKYLSLLSALNMK